MVNTRRNRNYLRGSSRRGRPAGGLRVAFKAKPRRGGLRGLTRRSRVAPGGSGLAPRQSYPRSLAVGVARYTSINGNMTNSKSSHLSVPLRGKPRVMSDVAVNTILSDQYAIRTNGAYGFQSASSYGFLTQPYLAKLPLYPTTLAGAALNLPYRMLLKSVTGNVTISNACTAPVELEIYDIVLKRDLPLALQWKQNANTWTVPQCYPDSMWAEGSYMNNNTINTGGTAQSSNIAASPFDVTIFNEFFKVKKRTKVLLTQGGVHRHSIVSNVNKIIDSVMFNQVSNASMTTPTSGFLGWKGVTSFVMINQKGLPVSDATNGAVVTTSETHIDVVQDFRIKWNWVSDNTRGVYNTDSLTTPASGQIINVGNGLAEPIAFTV